MIKVSITSTSEKYTPKISLTKAFSSNDVYLAFGSAEIRLTDSQLMEVLLCIENHYCGPQPKQEASQ